MEKRKRITWNKPRIGDFILFDDVVWIIRRINHETQVALAETALDIGIDAPEEFYLGSLAPTNIKTWEVE